MPPYIKKIAKFVILLRIFLCYNVYRGGCGSVETMFLENKEGSVYMYLVLVIVAALLALGFAAYNFFKVKAMDEGTAEMKEIASAIRIGANAFINYEYKILYIAVVVVAIIMAGADVLAYIIAEGMIDAANT